MISVCIATYNGGKYIASQLESILLQLSEKDEVIISDDGSSDNTISIINSFGDHRITILNNHHVGAIMNFENALKNAKGDYIFLSDQDDKWLPDKVKIMMQYLKNYDCVISDNIPVDGNLQPLDESFYKRVGMRTGKFYNLFIHNFYLGCCMACKRHVIEKALPFPSDIPMHDIWIGNVAAFFYNIKFIDEKLILFCRHGDNASSTANKSNYSLCQQISFRWKILKNLFIRRLYS